MDSKIRNLIKDLKHRAKIPQYFAKNCIQQLINEEFAQMAAVGFYMGLFYYGVSLMFLLPLTLYFIPKLRILCLLYYCWVYYDRNTPKMDGRKSKWYSNSKIFKWIRNYFPIRLIKTADLPEGRNYILAHYPHGLLPFSVMSNFQTNWNKESDIFPGIDMHYIVLDMHFMIPLIREVTLAIGGHSCSESSFTYLLKSKPSKGVIVLPGGTAETQYTRPGSIYTIIKRKGFVRLALVTGSPLVPVFTFGEINTWTKIYSISLDNWWSQVIKYLTNCSSLFLMSLGKGLLPKKIPVNTVVGAPIPVPKVENPSKELIDEYYTIFYQALEDLFEKYKYEYDTAAEKAKLVMLEKYKK